MPPSPQGPEELFLLNCPPSFPFSSQPQPLQTPPPFSPLLVQGRPPTMSKAGSGNHHHKTYQTPPPLRFHLLEINIISAQDLHPATYHMHAYVTAWVHSDHKLRTRLDTAGSTNPTWNDKLIFRVDDSFLQSDTSAITIHIYAARRLRSDPLVGTVRVVLSALHPSPATQFVALQVRRPTSLRPQGILNVGVALLDAYMQSMPLYSGPAFALKDLMDSPKRSLPRTSYSLPRTSYSSEAGENSPKHSLPRTSYSLPRTSYTGGVGEKDGEWQLERSSSVVEVGRKEVEALESKLEKWKIELSPVHDWERSNSARRRRQRRSTKRSSCFCGGGGRN